MQVGGVKPSYFTGVLRGSPGIPEREGPEKRGGAGTIGPAELTVFPSRCLAFVVPEETPEDRGTVFAAVACGIGFRPCFPDLGKDPPPASPRPFDSGARLPP